MSRRIFNFSAGPAVLPPQVLERAKEGLLSLNGSGMSVMEISHRSPEFEVVLEAAESGIRELLSVPSNFRILFLQGGASLQFSMIPLNFLKEGGSADYIVTGTWSEKALGEAKKRGDVNVICTRKDEGFRSAPNQEELDFNPAASYLHYCANETVHGVEFKYEIDGKGAHVICDASSNILSKPIDFSKYSMIYAGAQKNIGPSGVTLVIIRDDLLELVPDNQFSMLDYRLISKNDSMLNTPNTWGIYIVSLVCDWLRQQGGVIGIQKINECKAEMLYDAIDSSDGFFKGHAARENRSAMNVTFRLPSESDEERFASEAESRGFSGLRGHRSVGGLRASIYNAFPVEGVERLVAFMDEFRNRA